MTDHNHFRLFAANPIEISRLVFEAAQVGIPDRYKGKRECTRYAAGLLFDVTADPHEPGEARPVSMHNISYGGFAFWSRTQLALGQSLAIGEFTQDGHHVWLWSMVTHCTRGIKGFLIGVQFDVGA